MQIHQLTVAGRKKRKRIGRGGKRGTTSGKGTKGQKARSGVAVDPLFEGGRSTFLERMKKVRGFKSPHQKKYAVTLRALDRGLRDGETVTVALLVERGIAPKSALKTGVKVVATGTLSKKLVLGAGVAASEKARTVFSMPA